MLTLLGYNFGETADAAGNVSVTIGDVACAPVTIGEGLGGDARGGAIGYVDTLRDG